MYIDWWAMPGPAAFVSRVAQDLRSGVSAVVWLPQWIPNTFRQSLRGIASKYPVEREWERMDELVSADIEPIVWLWQLYNGRDTYPPVLTPASLLNAEQRVLPKGHILELPTCSTNKLPDWINFLLEYQQAAQQDRSIDRTGFLLVAEGFCRPLASLQAGPLLKVHVYKEQQTHLDMLLFLSQEIAQVHHPAKHLERQLAIQIAAVLFPFDPAYASTVAHRLLQDRIDSKAIEQQVINWQTDRDWQHISEQDLMQIEVGWSNGWTATIDEQSYQHVCAPFGPPRERVRQALLYAQMQVLLPRIEQIRWRLLHRPDIQAFVKQKLPRDFKYSDGTNQKHVEHVHQVEFTHLLELIASEPYYPLKNGKLLKEQIKFLRECRNDLSHVEPLTQEKLYQLIEMPDSP